MQFLTSLSYRSARNSKPLEVIGTYNPIPKKPTEVPEEAKAPKPFKDIALDSSRAKYWLGVGAQPSDPVWRLLSLVGGLFFFIPFRFVSNFELLYI